MKRCLPISVQLTRSLKQSSKTWRSRCRWGSALTVVGTWCWRRRERETGETMETTEAVKKKDAFFQPSSAGSRDVFVKNTPIGQKKKLTPSNILVLTFGKSTHALWHLSVGKLDCYIKSSQHIPKILTGVKVWTPWCVKMVCHSPWAELSQFEPDEFWHCHL